ncbi:MAG TPA: DUF445 domain-containing protein [Jatrophihabitantaceae bacterium]|jgi:uncharacterized membrane-anchored protein YjiN (DUF445 family)|nr:DUF445 domain-containing protein [Jatrophihabitantaceae bacterium]
MTIPMPGAERVRALRRMKVIAGGLLVAAAAIYIVCRALWNGHGAAGYVQAAAEASMVGGLADWFAVTALFRYPLGLPIPHTAIIPRKKDQIGEGLAGFVNEYFLTEEIVGERLAAAHVPRRIGEWLADPAHARQVAEELSKAVSGMAGVLRDDELRNAVAGFADKRLREIDVAPLIARLIDTICESGQHQTAFTAALRGTMRFLDENRSVFRRRLDQESPEWVPEWVDDRVFAKGFTALQSFLADVSVDPDHELRHTFDGKLRDVAARLRSDPAHAATIEQAKLDLLDRPDVRDWLSTIWLNVKKLVLDGAADPNSDLRRSVESLTIRAGEALRDDPAVAAKIDEALQRLTGHIVADYGDDLASVISATVERWDTAETSRRLELQVGRDLQFIRINGTVVGSLAGLAIYTISQLV